MSASSLKSRRGRTAARLSAVCLALGALAGPVPQGHAKDKPAPSAGPPAPDAATDPCLSDALCRAHYQRARTLSKDGELAAALAAYQAAYRRKPARWLLLNIGRTLHKLGKPAEALTTYRQFLDGESEAAPEARAKAREYIAEAEQELASAQRGTLPPPAPAQAPAAQPATPTTDSAAPAAPAAPVAPAAGTEATAPPAAAAGDAQALTSPPAAASPAAAPVVPGEPAVSPAGLASTPAQTGPTPAPPAAAPASPAPVPVAAPAPVAALAPSGPEPLVPAGRRLGLGIGLGVTAALALVGTGTGAAALQGQNLLGSTPYGGATPPPELQSVQDRTRITAAITDGALAAAAVSLTVTLAVTFARRPTGSGPAARTEKGAR